MRVFLAIFLLGFHTQQVFADERAQHTDEILQALQREHLVATPELLTCAAYMTTYPGTAAEKAGAAREMVDALIDARFSNNPELAPAACVLAMKRGGRTTSAMAKKLEVQRVALRRAGIPGIPNLVLAAALLIE